MEFLPTASVMLGSHWHDTRTCWPTCWRNHHIPLRRLTPKRWKTCNAKQIPHMETERPGKTRPVPSYASTETIWIGASSSCLRRSGQPRRFFSTRRACDELRPVPTEPRSPRAHCQEALKIATDMRFRPELALTRLQLAELLPGHYPDDKAEALEYLDFAINEFREMKIAEVSEVIQTGEVK